MVILDGLLWRRGIKRNVSIIIPVIMASSTAADIPTTRGRRKQAKPQRKNGRMKATKNLILFYILVYVCVGTTTVLERVSKVFSSQDIALFNLRSVTVLTLCFNAVTLLLFNFGLKIQFLYLVRWVILNDYKFMKYICVQIWMACVFSYGGGHLCLKRG